MVPWCDLVLILPKVLVRGGVGRAYGPIGLFLGRAELVLQLHGHLRYFPAVGQDIKVAVIVSYVYGSGGCILLYKHSRSAAPARHHTQLGRLQLHISLREVLLLRRKPCPDHSSSSTTCALIPPFHQLVAALSGTSQHPGRLQTVLLVHH